MDFSDVLLAIQQSLYTLFPRLDPAYRGAVEPRFTTVPVAEVGTTMATGYKVQGPRGGWFEVEGTFNGIYVHRGEQGTSTGNDELLESGVAVPLDRDGQAVIYGASVSSMVLRTFHFSEGLFRSASRGTVRVVTGGGTVGTTPTSQTYDTIALGAVAGYTLPANALFATFLAPGPDPDSAGNAHEAFVSDTVGHMAGGQRMILAPGASHTVYGASVTVQVQGTAGDVLKVVIYTA